VTKQAGWILINFFLSIEMEYLAKILSNENLEAIYNRFDPLREDTSKDPAFLDQIAGIKNPLQHIIHLKDNDIRFR